MSKKDKIISIHQPNYLPWLGYFYKIWASDIFVFLDDVQFSKQGYTQSVTIRKKRETDEIFKLTIPVKKAPISTPINEIQIHGHHWVKKHLKHITNIYQNAPFYNETKSLIEDIYDKANNIDSLSKFNIYAISVICVYIGIENEVVYASSMGIKAKSTKLLLEIIKQLEADKYISGKGSSKYLDNDFLGANGVQLTVLDFYSFMENNPYIRPSYPFVNGVSIIDALCIIGKEGVIELFEKQSLLGTSLESGR